MRWLLDGDEPSIEKSLNDIDEYLESRKNSAPGKFCSGKKLGSFDVKMMTIGATAMAFSMLSGEQLLTYGPW